MFVQESLLFFIDFSCDSELMGREAHQTGYLFDRQSFGQIIGSYFSGKTPVFIGQKFAVSKEIFKSKAIFFQNLDSGGRAVA